MYLRPAAAPRLLASSPSFARQRRRRACGLAFDVHVRDDAPCSVSVRRGPMAGVYIGPVNGWTLCAVPWRSGRRSSHGAARCVSVPAKVGGSGEADGEGGCWRRKSAWIGKDDSPCRGSGGGSRARREPQPPPSQGVRCSVRCALRAGRYSPVL